MYLSGMGAPNPGHVPSHIDDRRGRGRDFDERGGKCVLLVSELNAEVLITFFRVFRENYTARENLLILSYEK